MLKMAQGNHAIHLHDELAGQVLASLETAKDTVRYGGEKRTFSDLNAIEKVKVATLRKRELGRCLETATYIRLIYCLTTTFSVRGQPIQLAQNLHPLRECFDKEKNPFDTKGSKILNRVVDSVLRLFSSPEVKFEEMFAEEHHWASMFKIGCLKVPFETVVVNQNKKRKVMGNISNTVALPSYLMDCNPQEQDAVHPVTVDADERLWVTILPETVLDPDFSFCLAQGKEERENAFAQFSNLVRRSVHSCPPNPYPCLCVLTSQFRLILE